MMKTKKIFLLLFCISIFATCCKPEQDSDYRDEWVGTYDFTTTDYVHYFSHDLYDSASLVIIDDTVSFTGTIEKYKENLLKITFKPNAAEPELGGIVPVKINGLIYPTVDSSGNITYPKFGEDRRYFEGSFSGNEIYIYYCNYYGPLGKAGKEYHSIQGIKK